MSTPTVFVTYFGGSPDWLKLLEEWLEMFRQTGCGWEYVVLCDTDTKLPVDVPGFIVRADDCSRLIRPGNPYDRKSALICAALWHLPDRSIVVDVDAFFVKDPASTLLPFIDLPFAIAHDAGRRLIGLDAGPIAPEESSSVMVFGSRRNAPRLVAEYQRAFFELATHASKQGAMEDQIREQRAWSLVAQRVGAPTLPVVLNDSRFYGAPRPETIIYHAHGEEKWKLIGLTK